MYTSMSARQKKKYFECKSNNLSINLVLLVKILFTKVSSGAHDDLVHEQRSTMMDFKFHIPFGHSNQHTLGLDIGIRIEYTCPL